MWTVTRLATLLSVATLASQDHLPGSCMFEGRSVPDGARMAKSDPCHLCHCHDGRLECVWKHCGPPPPGCRTLETDNACNQTVYVCPLPEDNDNTSSSSSSESITSSTTLGPYFPALTSSTPSSDSPLTTQFSLLPPPLPSLSPSLEGRQSETDEPGTGPTYFNEFSSAPMNFSAALSRGEGPRSPSRQPERQGDSEDDRLRFSSPKPWEGPSDEETSERTSERTTDRTTLRALGRTSYRPGSRRPFRISRPHTVSPAEREETQATQSTDRWTSTKALGRTQSSTSSRDTTWTTRTTPRTRPWTTSQTTVRSSSLFREEGSARPNSKPRLRFPKRPNLLLAVRERLRSEEDGDEETTRPSFHQPESEPLRTTHHPILRPRIRPLSLAEPSKLVQTTAEPETVSAPVTEPRRLGSRPSRRQLKTLSTTRHRLQRLFPSTVRPDTGRSSEDLRSREPDLTTIKPEASTFSSSRRRVRPLSAFQSLSSSSPIPRPRSRFPSTSPQARLSSFSPSNFDVISPSSIGNTDRSSFPTFQEASASTPDSATPLEQGPPFLAVPAAVPLAAPVVSFDYDLEDDSIDLTEYEFPEFGRRLRRETSKSESQEDVEQERGDTGGSGAKFRGRRNVRDEQAEEGESWRANRLRRSLLPGDERHDHGHHGHHRSHPHSRDHRDPDLNREDDLKSSRNRLGEYRGIGAKKSERNLRRPGRRIEDNKAEEDFRSFQSLGQNPSELSVCFVSGLRFKLGEVIEAASDGCLECRCAGAAMFCYPKCCFYTTEAPTDGQTQLVL